ncbi:MAG: ABC transporter permease [Acidobacteriota bacterium]
MLKLDPLTKKRFAKFRRLKRGYYSLWILTITYVLSLGIELFVGNRPIFVSFGGRTYFPALNHRYYGKTLFGGSADEETDFRELAASPEFKAAGGRILLPVHPFSPLESIKIPGDPPPSKPSWSHPMGTDDRGRDVLARLLYGFRTSVSFGLVLSVLATVLGIVIGAIQGYWGGWIDISCQRLIEIWSALPFLYVVVLVSSILTPGFWLLVVILLVFDWIGTSRYVRGEFLRERNLDYVTAARALGASSGRIIFSHVMGNALSPVITLFPFTLVGSIFFLTSLDYLGFGIPAPAPSWGELFEQGRGQITTGVWIILSPFSALVSTLLLTTFIGEAMREAWDPREFYRRE